MEFDSGWSLPPSLADSRSSSRNSTAIARWPISARAAIANRTRITTARARMASPPLGSPALVRITARQAVSKNAASRPAAAFNSLLIRFLTTDNCTGNSSFRIVFLSIEGASPVHQSIMKTSVDSPGFSLTVNPTRRDNDFESDCSSQSNGTGRNGISQDTETARHVSLWRADGQSNQNQSMHGSLSGRLRDMPHRFRLPSRR